MCLEITHLLLIHTTDAAVFFLEKQNHGESCNNFKQEHQHLNILQDIIQFHPSN